MGLLPIQPTLCNVVYLHRCFLIDAVVRLARLYRRYSLTSWWPRDLTMTPWWPRVDGHLAAAQYHVQRRRSDRRDPAHHQQVPASLVRADRQPAHVRCRVEPTAGAIRRRPPRQKVLEKVLRLSWCGRKRPVKAGLGQAIRIFSLILDALKMRGVSSSVGIVLDQESRDVGFVRSALVLGLVRSNGGRLSCESWSWSSD